MSDKNKAKINEFRYKSKSAMILHLRIGNVTQICYTVKGEGLREGQALLAELYGRRSTQTRPPSSNCSATWQNSGS